MGLLPPGHRPGDQQRARGLGPGLYELAALGIVAMESMMMLPFHYREWLRLKEISGRLATVEARG